MSSSVLMKEGVSLTLTPMEISNVPMRVGNELSTSEFDAVTVQKPCVTIHPGELCHVILEIKNWESCVQHLTLELTGNFPLHWCQLEIASENGGFDTSPSRASTHLKTLEIPAKKSLPLDLWFTVPTDFFEDDDRPTLSASLDYQGCISAYTNLPTGSSADGPIQQTHFNLCIRPQSDYASFLPTVYQEVDFINRFVKIFEEAFDPVVNSFNSMWAHLDPLTAPQALLPFLARWIDWPLDSQLDLFQQRRLMRRAVEIYRLRGTRKGLRFYLHLYTGLPLDDHLSCETDKSICITESFSQGCLLGVAHLGHDTVLGGGNPYHFQVCLKVQRPQVVDEQLVRRIIDQEKPAFCTYDLKINIVD